MASMRAHAGAGVCEFDMGDIYPGVEELAGAFLRQHFGEGAGRGSVKLLTKFVPDKKLLGSIDAAYVRRVVQRSCNRLGVDCVDRVQLHWWDYEAEGLLQTGQALAQLQQEGLLSEVGLTNTDTAHLRALVEGGVPVVSNQVQYSLIDRRAETELLPYCLSRTAEGSPIELIAYGVLGGGFLSDGWLGKPEPEPTAPEVPPSARKYLAMITEAVRTNGHFDRESTQRLSSDFCAWSTGWLGAVPGSAQRLPCCRRRAQPCSGRGRAREHRADRAGMGAHAAWCGRRHRRWDFRKAHRSNAASGPGPRPGPHSGAAEQAERGEQRRRRRDRCGGLLHHRARPEHAERRGSRTVDECRHPGQTAALGRAEAAHAGDAEAAGAPASPLCSTNRQHDNHGPLVAHRIRARRRCSRCPTPSRRRDCLQPWVWPASRVWPALLRHGSACCRSFGTTLARAVRGAPR